MKDNLYCYVCERRDFNAVNDYSIHLETEEHLNCLNLKCKRRTITQNLLEVSADLTDKLREINLKVVENEPRAPLGKSVERIAFENSVENLHCSNCKTEFMTWSEYIVHLCSITHLENCVYIEGSDASNNIDILSFEQVEEEIKDAKILANSWPLSPTNLPSYNEDDCFGLDFFEKRQCFYCHSCKIPMLHKDVHSHSKLLTHFLATIELLKNEKTSARLIALANNNQQSNDSISCEDADSKGKCFLSKNCKISSTPTKPKDLTPKPFANSVEKNFAVSTEQSRMRHSENKINTIVSSGNFNSSEQCEEAKPIINRSRLISGGVKTSNLKEIHAGKDVEIEGISSNEKNAKNASVKNHKKVLKNLETEDISSDEDEKVSNVGYKSSTNTVDVLKTEDISSDDDDGSSVSLSDESIKLEDETADAEDERKIGTSSKCQPQVMECLETEDISSDEEESLLQVATDKSIIQRKPSIQDLETEDISSDEEEMDIDSATSAIKALPSNNPGMSMKPIETEDISSDEEEISILNKTDSILSNFVTNVQSQNSSDDEENIDEADILREVGEELEFLYDENERESNREENCNQNHMFDADNYVIEEADDDKVRNIDINNSTCLDTSIAEKEKLELIKESEIHTSKTKESVASTKKDPVNNNLVKVNRSKKKDGIKIECTIDLKRKIDIEDSPQQLGGLIVIDEYISKDNSETEQEYPRSSQSNRSNKRTPRKVYNDRKTNSSNSKISDETKLLVETDPLNVLLEVGEDFDDENVCAEIIKTNKKAESDKKVDKTTNKNGKKLKPDIDKPICVDERNDKNNVKNTVKKLPVPALLERASRPKRSVTGLLKTDAEKRASSTDNKSPRVSPNAPKRKRIPIQAPPSTISTRISRRNR